MFIAHGLLGLTVLESKVHGAPGPVAALPYRCHLRFDSGEGFALEDRRGDAADLCEQVFAPAQPLPP